VSAHLARRDAGFTLIEVVITLLVLSVIAISFASSIQFSARLMGRSEIELHAAQFLESEAERLRSLSLDSLVTGSRSEGWGQAGWQVADSTTFVQIVLTTQYGTATAGTVADSVTIVRVR